MEMCINNVNVFLSYAQDLDNSLFLLIFVGTAFFCNSYLSSYNLIEFNFPATLLKSHFLNGITEILIR